MYSDNDIREVKKDCDMYYEVESYNSDNHSKFYDKDYDNKRQELPAKREKTNFSVWEILKNAIGKDLGTFSIPVFFNEPLSMLQRLCENFQYADLLNKAAIEENKYVRLALVSAFCIGGFAQSPKRTLKYFNPLLFETYEYIDNDMNFRYFAEQVCHHPPISACYAEGEDWTFNTNTHLKSNFKLWKNKLEFIALSRAFIKLNRFSEKITYTKPVAVVQHLLTNVYIDCYGTILIRNENSGDYAEVRLYESNKHEQGKLSGEIRSFEGEVIMYIEGNWLSNIDIVDLKDFKRKTIWTINPIRGDEEEKYCLTDFSINLNNLTDDLAKKLPRTDSRFRPDQRALEVQNLSLAASEKRRLEDKQRARKREYEKKGLRMKPNYFTASHDEVNSEYVYTYSRDYWKDRKESNFNHLPDIF
jgi:hypothetical protein